MEFREFLLGNKDMIMGASDHDQDNEAIIDLIQEWDNDSKADAAVK